MVERKPVYFARTLTERRAHRRGGWTGPDEGEGESDGGGREKFAKKRMTPSQVDMWLGCFETPNLSNVMI